MKKFFILAIAAVGLMLAGCNSIKEINERLDGQDERITALENQVKEINDQLDAIQKLLSGKYFVSDVVELPDGAGYRLVLVNGSGKTFEKIVYNGTDGKEPAVGISQDSDGNWYWTLNGEWLFSGGQKVRANGEDGADGKDGATPQIKLENEKWYVSFDGVNWTYVGDAASETSGLISSIDMDSDPYNVIFTLAGGATFSVPKAASAVKLQLLFDETPFSEITEGGSAKTDYEVIVPQGVTYKISSYEPASWVVTISSPQGNKGSISISIPEGAKTGKVLFAVNGSDGSSFVRIVEVGVQLKEEYTLDSAGGSIVISGASNLSLVGEAGWVTVSGTKVILSENTGYDSRSATLTYTDAEGQQHVVVIVQAQKDAIVVTSSEVGADAEGGEIPFVVKANVSVKAASDAAWLTVNPSTKALEDKIFTLTAAANDGAAQRVATVTFSSGELSQIVKVTQAGKSVTPVPGGGVFTLLSDASSLQAGDRILIVNAGGDFAMGPQANSNYRGIEPVTVSGGSISNPSEDVQVITLGGSAGAWELQVGDGEYLAAQSANSNYLRTVGTVNEYAQWSIDISGGEATIKANAGSRAVICYNASATRFSCYQGASSAVSLVAVYKEETSYDPASDPILAKSAYGCYLGSDTRTYKRGSDQIVRYAGGFALADPATNEQLSISGFSGKESVGDAVNINLDWKKGVSRLRTGTFRMHVAKLDGSVVWFGDGKGNGFIIKK